MVTQNPSRIFKSDFSVWKKQYSGIVNEIFSEDKSSALKAVSEIILEENGSYPIHYRENSSILIIVLYGELMINDFEKPISTEQVFTLQSSENNTLFLRNNLQNEKADFLIFELECETLKNSFSIEDLDIKERNTLFKITERIKVPNFIGLYEGRKEEVYSLYRQGKSVFGMVINGAFEFQNRLMETRDAIVLTEIETLEFEALSEDALLLFLEF